MLRYYAAKFTRDLELPANLHIFVYIVFIAYQAFYVKFYCETVFHFGFKHCVKGCYEESEGVTREYHATPKVTLERVDTWLCSYVATWLLTQRTRHSHTVMYFYMATWLCSYVVSAYPRSHSFQARITFAVTGYSLVQPKAKLEKSPWVTVKKKPGPKKFENHLTKPKNFSWRRATRVLCTPSQIFYNCLGSRESRGREIG